METSSTTRENLANAEEIKKNTTEEWKPETRL